LRFGSVSVSMIRSLAIAAVSVFAIAGLTAPAHASSAQGRGSVHINFVRYV
jgi:hypothetical protein